MKVSFNSLNRVTLHNWILIFEKYLMSKIVQLCVKMFMRENLLLKEFYIFFLHQSNFSQERKTTIGYYKKNDDLSTLFSSFALAIKIYFFFEMELRAMKLFFQIFSFVCNCDERLFFLKKSKLQNFVKSISPQR